MQGLSSYKDLSFGLMELMFIWDAFEFTALCDEPRVALLDQLLLVHDLRDLLRHHLRHLLTHIVLQSVQVVKLLVHLQQ